MQTLIDILIFLLNVFGSLYLSFILLRFLLQMARADFYNPVSQRILIDRAVDGVPADDLFNAGIARYNQEDNQC